MIHCAVAKDGFVVSEVADLQAATDVLASRNPREYALSAVGSAIAIPPAPVLGRIRAALSRDQPR